MVTSKSRERRIRCEAGSTRASDSGSEAAAALTPARGKDGPAGARAHPQPKPVGLVALAVVRLERSFTHNFSDVEDYGSPHAQPCLSPSRQSARSGGGKRRGHAPQDRRVRRLHHGTGRPEHGSNRAVACPKSVPGELWPDTRCGSSRHADAEESFRADCGRRVELARGLLLASRRHEVPSPLIRRLAQLSESDRNPCAQPVDKHVDCRSGGLHSTLVLPHSAPVFGTGSGFGAARLPGMYRPATDR